MSGRALAGRSSIAEDRAEVVIPAGEGSSASAEAGRSTVRALEGLEIPPGEGSPLAKAGDSAVRALEGLEIPPGGGSALAEAGDSTLQRATDQKKVRFDISESPDDKGISPSAEAGDSNVQATPPLRIEHYPGATSMGVDIQALIAERQKSHVHLSNTNVADESERVKLWMRLFELASDPKLKSIKLSFCRIDEVFEKKIVAKISSFTSLQEIDLSDNKIGDEGAKVLAEALKNSKSLEHIFLEENIIRVEGATALLEAMNSRNFPPPTLNLRGNFIPYNIPIKSNGRYNFHASGQKV